ncbi:autotransporter outer membrane beta-barrel domain-containing protein [Endozoicomonas sp. YOMI1]|uniref:autotransporter outer membrane beta-barrel domain-containing protein n=1 Tax=Endozoicomonas sp. YOMI1 TaxID=2828739 RepID=UPI002148C026|nr:autotransporter outer membrane beta-barrel domain-containing protein [Endozoicomonas sp. YOMI1]
MIGFKCETFHKKILVIAISTVISTLTQNSYAGNETEGTGTASNDYKETQKNSPAGPDAHNEALNEASGEIHTASPNLNYIHNSDTPVNLRGSKTRNDELTVKGGSAETVQTVSSSALQHGFSTLNLHGVAAPVALPADLESLKLTSTLPIGRVYAVSVDNLEKERADKAQEIPNPTFMPYSVRKPQSAALKTDIHEAASAANILFSDKVPEGKGVLATNVTEDYERVYVNSRGTLGEVNLSPLQSRPSFIIRLIGVNGHLHFLADRMAIVSSSSDSSRAEVPESSPALHIRQGAVVTIPSELNIDGNYQQDGRLVLTERDPDAARFVPLTDGAIPQVPVAAAKILDDRMSGKRTGINAGDIFSAGTAWIQYEYSKATQDIKDDVPGYHARTNGFSMGADNPLEEDQNTEVGIAYTYAKEKVEGKDGSSSKIDTDTHIISLYSSYQEDDFFFDGRMSYSSGKNKGHRYVDGHLHDAKYDTRSWGVGMVAGHTYPLGYEWSWQPQVALNYYTIKTDGYTESGRDPAQSHLSYDQVNNGKYDIMELGAGLKLIGEINTHAMVIKPELGLMGLHDFKKDPIAITAHFAAGGEHFRINGADRDNNRYQFDASMNVEIQGNTTITFRYLHHWTDNFKVDGCIARVRYNF